MAEAHAALAAGGSSNPNVAKIAIERRKKTTDVVEPQVISEELLIEGVEEPLKPDGDAYEPIEFPNVTSMRLSFQNIIEVSNLNNFDNLTTLRLDNNIIDEIKNLDRLKNLTWLDLSFNNIREIKGLDQLANLTDLSLYHNQIEEIRGLDNNPKLNILSLGHNNIKELKQIDNLRKFTNLRCVCLEGNKVCQNDSYNHHILAYLTSLKYLDYMLIDKKAVTQAHESYLLDELTELREREAAESAKDRSKNEKEAVIEKLKNAFLDCTEDLFEEMFAKAPAGPETENLTVLGCYGTLKEDFRDKLADEIKCLRTWMEEKNETRVKKVVAFEKSTKVAEKESEDEAFQMVRDFKSLKKKVLDELDKGDGAPNKGQVDNMIRELLGMLTELDSHLMANEIQLQESIEEAIHAFEGQVQDLKNAMAEKGSDFFRKLEDHEKFFYTGIVEGATSEMEAFSQIQDSAIGSDTDPMKAKYLLNREDMGLACSNLNEAHTNMITSKDDYMQNQMSSWMREFFAGHRERQYHRNRQRIMDVKKVIDKCKEEIEEASQAADYDDEHDNGGDAMYGR